MKIEVFYKKILDMLPKNIRPFIYYNLEYNYIKLRKFFNHGFKNIPVSVFIETNSICNRVCSYCPRPLNKTDTLSVSVFKSILEQLKDWKFKGRIYPHLYNEPLTDKRIFDLLRYIPNPSGIGFYTNGIALDSKAIEKLTEIGIKPLRVTIHENTTDAEFMRLKELERKYNSIIITDYRSKARKRLLQNRGGLVKLKNTYLLNRGCMFVNALAIRANGDVVLCCQDILSKHFFGNVNKEDIKDIWEKEDYKRIRKEITNGIYSLNICKTCGYGNEKL